MKVSYYPGCSLKGSARDYEASIQSVCRLLDIELCELEDWNCCGSTAAHSLSHRAGINLSARNIAIAEEAGSILLNADRQATIKKNLRSVRRELGEKGSSARAADVLLKMVAEAKNRSEA